MGKIYSITDLKLTELLDLQGRFKVNQFDNEIQTVQHPDNSYTATIEVSDSEIDAVGYAINTTLDLGECCAADFLYEKHWFTSV